MVPGEKKDLSKISVGNIYPVGSRAILRKWRKQYRKEGLSEKEIDELLSGGSIAIAAKVRRLLKASKRRGKRRTKKQLLQDVLDL